MKRELDVWQEEIKVSLQNDINSKYGRALRVLGDDYLRGICAKAIIEVMARQYGSAHQSTAQDLMPVYWAMLEDNGIE